MTRGGPRIAIVGAGLGGATAAVYLQRLGYRTDVYEQAEQLQRIGAGIALSPNVTQILDDLGLLERLEQIGMVPSERHGRDGRTGAMTFEVPIAQFRAQYGGPHLFMHRGDLLEILAATIVPERLHLGKRLVDITEVGADLQLSFADGSTADADIVVGADGINSRVREVAIGGEPAFYSGEVAHRSIYPRSLLGDMPIADLTKWWGPDRYVMVYFITRTREDVYFVTGAPQAWPSETYTPVATARAALVSAFADFCPQIRRVLEAAPSATTWPICERDPAPGWSRGRIVLLGDACHAMQNHMGQGAAMAFEDAVVLARCLHLYEGSNAAASFELYERLRFDRASRVQLASRGNDWMRHGIDADWLYGYNAARLPLSADLSRPASTRIPA